MRYVQINAYSGAWADSIVFKKHRELIAFGDESWVFWARGDHEQDDRMQKIANFPEVCFDALLTRIDGKAAFHSKSVTRRLLAKLDEINPDIVHLHVLTGYYLNVEMLFNWILRHRCKVVWTLHDCWDFTGHCIYFTYAKCSQWRTGCAVSCSCPQKREYPESWFAGDSRVRENYERKRALFTALPADRVQLIVPSQWLAGLVKQSFLGKYNVKVVPNTVDPAVFKHCASDFKAQHGLKGKFVVLGVASKWSQRKGLEDFIRLARDLDHSVFSIVLVGLSSEQIKELGRKSPRILALPRTSTAEELVGIYSACDVLFNPTKEDNYPTVNLEAEACGLPVFTYDTGGCAETLRLSDSVVLSGYKEGIAAIRRFATTKASPKSTGDNKGLALCCR